MLNEEGIWHLLQVKDLDKSFYNQSGFWLRKSINALTKISFNLERGETLAIIGETGSGKSTLAKILAGMIPATSGEIRIEGVLIEHDDYCTRAPLMRMVFQDPNSSLNPKLRIGRILETPLILNTDLNAEERKRKVEETLELVGLQPEHRGYYASMLSSGQKQRIALARAIILNPKIVIADDSLITQDVSVRGQMINLLLDMQQRIGLSYILVSNDLGLISHISDSLLVMHQGQIVERGRTLQVFSEPKHQITKRLLDNYQNEYRL